MKPEKQLAKAAVEWRRAELNLHEARLKWLACQDLGAVLDALHPAYQKFQQRTQIRDGTLAKVAMLADILIEQKREPTKIDWEAERDAIAAEYKKKHEVES